MGIMYYLKNDNMEKWSVAWRIAIVVGLMYLAFIFAAILVGSYSVLLNILGGLIFIVVGILVVLFQLQIVYNQIVSKYFDGESVTIGNLFKKYLAFLVIDIATVIVMELIFVILIVLGAASGSGFLGFIFGILAIILMIFALTVLVDFWYAVFDGIGKKDYGFGSTFSEFGKIIKSSYKKTFIDLLKCGLLLLITFIVYIIIVTILVAISALLNSVFMALIIGTIIFAISIFTLPYVALVCTQYILGIYFKQD